MKNSRALKTHFEAKDQNKSVMVSQPHNSSKNGLKHTVLATTLASLLLCQSLVAQAQSNSLAQMQSLVESLEGKSTQQVRFTQPTVVQHPNQQTQVQPKPSVQSIIEQRLETPLSINTAETPMTFESLINYISNAIRIPIILKNFYASTTGGTTPIASMPMPATGGNIANMTPGITQIGYVTFYANNEPARYVLDQLCGLYDLSWKIDGNKIVIYKYEQRIFHIQTPLLQQTLNIQQQIEQGSNLSSGGTTTTASGNSGLNLLYNRKFNLQTIEASIKAILKDKYDSVSINNLGYVFVRARPSEIKMIKQYVNRLNKYFATPITLKLSVFIVKLNNNTTAGLNIFNFAKAVNAPNTIISSGFSQTLTQPGFSPFTIGVTNLSNQYIFQALQQIGDAKTLESELFTTLNGEPLVWSPTTQQTIVSNYQLTYLAPTNGTNVATTTSTPTITTQTQVLQTGTTLVIVPYLEKENGQDSVVLNLYRAQAELPQAPQVFNVDLAGSQNQIELPTIQTYSQLQGAILKKGQTFVLLSSIVTSKQIQKQGIPFLENIPVLGYLFGTHIHEDDKFQIVVTLKYV